MLAECLSNTENQETSLESQEDLQVQYGLINGIMTSLHTRLCNTTQPCSTTLSHILGEKKSHLGHHQIKETYQ